MIHRRVALLLAVVCLCPHATGRARGLPATAVSYRISVRVDPATRALQGTETVTWVNRSSHPVTQVPLHLYLNAFAHLGTTWMREAGVYFAGYVDHERFLELFPDPWGWNEPSGIQQVVDGKPLRAGWRPIQPDDGNPLDRTLIAVRLPRPVPAGDTLVLRIAFSGRLPVPVARTGCVDGYCLVAQWFPKIGMFDLERQRWVARQFHAPTEFFAEFADYDVTIEAPAGWILGATGQRAGARAAGPRQRVRYRQRAVHDFAFVVGRDLHQERSTHRPPVAGATPVQVRYLLPRNLAHQVPRARRAIQRTLNLFARRVGPFPYATLTVVMPPWSARRTAGMEYPTLITGTPADPLWDRFPLADFRAPEFTLVHELGHQYFYGLLATDEQQEALLDEGLNSHWDGRAMQALFGQVGSAGWALGRPVDAIEFYAHGMAGSRHQVFEPVRRRPAELFYPGSQRHQIYGRGALTLWTALRRFGPRSLDRVFAAYYRRHRFGHPHLSDFLDVARQHGAPGMAPFLDEAFSQPRVPDFRVAHISSHPYRAPLGRVIDEKGTVTVTPAGRRHHLARFAGRNADERGRVWIEVTDPGWSRGAREQPGTVRWTPFWPSGAPATRQTELHESRARIVGPAWDNLPVTVLLRFDDGVEIRERWDGRAAWRGYRVVRPARLTAVLIDESHGVALDVVPQNNGRLLEPDRRLVSDWGGWLGALVQWLAGGLSLWL